MEMTKKEEKYLLTFTTNLNEGISYYKSMFNELKNTFQEIKEEVLNELDKGEKTLSLIHLEIQNLAVQNIKSKVAS